MSRNALPMIPSTRACISPIQARRSSLPRIQAPTSHAFHQSELGLPCVMHGAALVKSLAPKGLMPVCSLRYGLTRCFLVGKHSLSISTPLFSENPSAGLLRRFILLRLQAASVAYSSRYLLSERFCSHRQMLSPQGLPCQLSRLNLCFDAVPVVFPECIRVRMLAQELCQVFTINQAVPLSMPHQLSVAAPSPVGRMSNNTCPNHVQFDVIQAVP